MIAEVGRDVADLETALRILRAPVDGRLGPEIAGVSRVPLLIGGEDFLRREIGAVVQAEQQVRVRDGEIRLDLDRLLEAFAGLAQPVLVHQRRADVVLSVGVLGIELEGAPRGRFGLARVARKRQAPGQVGPGVGIIGLQLDGATEMLLGISGEAAILIYRSKVVMSFGRLRRQAHRFASLLLGLLETPDCAQHRRDVPSHVGARRIFADRLQQVIDGFRQTAQAIGGDAAHMAGFTVVGIGRKRIGRKAERRLRIAGLKGGERGCE